MKEEKSTHPGGRLATERRCGWRGTRGVLRVAVAQWGWRRGKRESRAARGSSRWGERWSGVNRWRGGPSRQSAVVRRRDEVATRNDVARTDIRATTVTRRTHTSAYTQRLHAVPQSTRNASRIFVLVHAGEAIADGFGSLTERRVSQAVQLCGAIPVSPSSAFLAGIGVSFARARARVSTALGLVSPADESVGESTGKPRSGGRNRE